MFVEKSSLTF